MLIKINYLLFIVFIGFKLRFLINLRVKGICISLDLIVNNILIKVAFILILYHCWVYLLLQIQVNFILAFWLLQYHWLLNFLLYYFTRLYIFYGFSFWLLLFIFNLISFAFYITLGLIYKSHFVLFALNNRLTDSLFCCSLLILGCL